MMHGDTSLLGKIVDFCMCVCARPPRGGKGRRKQLAPAPPPQPTRAPSLRISLELSKVPSRSGDCKALKASLEIFSTLWSVVRLLLGFLFDVIEAPRNKFASGPANFLGGPAHVISLSIQCA